MTTLISLIRCIATATPRFLVLIVIALPFELHAQSGILRAQTTIGGQITPPGLTDVLDMAAGKTAAAAIKMNGQLVLWGSAEFGLTNAPADLPPVKDVAVGDRHVAVVTKEGGRLILWGDNSEDQLNAPPGLSNIVEISAGEAHTLARTATGAVYAWGRKTEGQASIPPNLTNAISISAGARHSLALASNRTVVGWGSNSHGQSAIPTTTANALAIAAGGRHSVALLADWTVVAWGDNSQGQYPSPFLRQVMSIAAGADNTLTLSADGTAREWGPRMDRHNFAFGVTKIAAGGDYIMALILSDYLDLLVGLKPQAVMAGSDATFQVAVAGSRNIAYEWSKDGARIPGATNSSYTIPNASPADAASYRVFFVIPGFGGSGSIAKLDVFAGHPGALIPWGMNGSRQFDDLPSRSNNVSVALSHYEVIGLLRGGEIWRSGANITPASSLMEKVTNAVEVEATEFRSLFLQADGTIVEWGSRPKAPAGISNIIQASLAPNFTLAVRADGQALAWGSTSEVVTNIPNRADIAAISAGARHALALTKGGEVLAWGNNSSGQATVPAGLTNVVAIAASKWANSIQPTGDHNLALKADGTVVAWGSNQFGQSDVPPGLGNVVAIAAGASHSVALKSDGTVVAWGDNTFRQLDIPGGLTNVVAIRAGARNTIAILGERPPGRAYFEIFALSDNPPDLAGAALAIRTTAGVRFRVERSQDLEDWATMAEYVGTGSTMPFSDRSAAQSSRNFYRVVAE